jgi:hypothetical protein
VEAALALEKRAVLVGFVRHAVLLEGRVSSRPAPHSGGKPPQSLRCGDPARRLLICAVFAAEVAGGRLKTQTRPRVGGFPSNGRN